MGDKPYVVPLNYAYVDGRILFHCAMTGKKLDYLQRNQRVCFAVARQFGEIRRHAEENLCHVDSDSVICYGRARIIEDLEERTGISRINRVEIGPINFITDRVQIKIFYLTREDIVFNSDQDGKNQKNNGKLN